MAGIRKTGQQVLPTCTTEAEKQRVKDAIKIIREHCQNNISE
jgi:hypothetical protein